MLIMQKFSSLAILFSESPLTHPGIISTVIFFIFKHSFALQHQTKTCIPSRRFTNMEISFKAEATYREYVTRVVLADHCIF